MSIRLKISPWFAGWFAAAIAISIAATGVAEVTVLAPGSVTHLGPRTVVETGRTRVIAFRVDPPAGEDTPVSITVDDDRLLSVLGPGMAGADAPVGYLRIRGEKPGRTTIRVNNAPLEIEVVASRAPYGAAIYRPQMVGPVSGAAVWGTVAVGVETRLPPGPPRAIGVRVAGGRMLDVVTDTGERERPYRRLRFTLDATGFEPGPLPLEVIVDEKTVGPATIVRIVEPTAESITSGEAEAVYKVERPARFSDTRMNIGRDRDASGGEYFANASATPAVCFPVEVQSTGWYQVALVAGGSSAQGALPTVGLVVDGNGQSTTNGRLLDTEFHRIALGVPFKLEEGRRILTPLFANDFYVARRADRNLKLDRIEVARLADATNDMSSDEKMAMGMGMPAMGMDMAGGKGMAGGGAAAEAPAMNVDDPDGAANVPLRIAFVRPLDGLPLPGLIEIEGRAWWVDDQWSPPPLVTLMVNDFPAMEERSGAPRFWVDPSNFWDGDNTIQLVARLDDGTTARTPVQTMHWPAAPEMSPRPRQHRRFSIHEPAWGTKVAAHLHSGLYPKERVSFVMFSNGTAHLQLPEGMSGEYEVFLEAYGQDFEGPPKAELSLEVRGAAPVPIGTVEPRTWWETKSVGSVTIPPGEKAIALKFSNDHHKKDEGDRNLRVQAILLAQKPIVPDERAPEASISYPADGQPVYGTDALVAEASDDASIDRVELIIDDVPTGAALTLNLKPGRVVFPLLLRALTPGAHSVTVRATDVAGNSTIAEPRTIVVSAEPPATPGPYDRAVRFLNVFAYGPSSDDLAEVLTEGRRDWLARQLDGTLEHAGDRAAFTSGLPHFVNRNPTEVAGRTLAHLINTPRPARARFVLWAENHFSTWIRKVQGAQKWDEHLMFTRLGAAPFDQLLFASAESPAMLTYLDQASSYAGRLNENYAREIMELHTLGVDGGYSQQDVTNLAALFTGWTVALEGDGRGGGPLARTYSFRYDPRLNDGGGTSVLGMVFGDAGPDTRYDRARVAIEMLAAHPSTARYISHKLVASYLSNPPPEDLVDTLTQVFHDSGGDMRELMLALADDPRVTDPAGTERITTPLEFGVRLLRATSHFDPWKLNEFLQRSGHGVFDRSTPDGYPHDDVAYTDSNAMIQRLKLAQDRVWQLANLVPGAWRYGNDVPEDEWTQLVIDAVAVRLTGQTLSASSYEAATRVLTSATGTRDERVRVVAPFIASLPEANLR